MSKLAVGLLSARSIRDSEARLMPESSASVSSDQFFSSLRSARRRASRCYVELMSI
ncbi:hypothetical protein EHW99_2333 [Erwinia amylovora]|uniref:Uncharacterized protein n=2 Tax=Erwinia amylovora TaxID=552 RepID=A0A831EJF3_ERWAM|nr:hypothetical protein EaACW_1257 [Erwinia amylovora ACW56400]QJQ55035.1 hypothetical protein EHX00_2333 [Erwinia amylovora]CBA20198.1 hypothetical protein predicted by Glimmer/Critica [Erwinia amylovora CFBP1430]CCO78103.1 hypothetical protein BN432_1293 [Erwinia amylovora Ea356]CCO81890.1 hypothetical protein BN433_1306 [Erwinia amylovora Ea266]CCO85689.1 hypothetical protein BN434_1289 [Erwinia amylovora CFBP 2585]CCO89475.1 hypothetical protein BN435_1291 [Erwinia amylovora 01SFR-BO]CCO